MVRISVLIDKDGVPYRFQVESGPSELVNASLDAVKQWRYEPYKMNGEAVPVETSININYVLPSTKSAGRTAEQ